MFAEGERDCCTASMIVKGAVAGMAGGLVASWVMNQFQAILTKATNREQQPEPAPQGEPATAQLAVAVSQRVFHHRLTEQEKKVAEPAVHYGYGTLAGGMYGGLYEVLPVVGACAGTAYGAALWMLGDEVAVPLLGLSRHPKEFPVSTHVSALMAHLVYGATTEGVRRLLRHLV